MPANESTALSRSTSSTPSRRTSWKDKTDSNTTSNTMNEKNLIPPTSANPFSDPPTTPSSTSALFSDLESQSPTSSPTTKPRLTHRFVIYAYIAFAMLLWLLMIAGVMFMFDYSMLSAFRWYGMWKDIKGQMVVKDKAMDMLKSQVGTLKSQMGAMWRVVDGLGGLGSVVALNETVGSGSVNVTAVM